MVLKRENPELLLQKQVMQYTQRNPKQNTCKLEMDFKRENHELLLHKQFMQLNRRNPKNRTPMLYSTDFL